MVATAAAVVGHLVTLHTLIRRGFLQAQLDSLREEAAGSAQQLRKAQEQAAAAEQALSAAQQSAAEAAQAAAQDKESTQMTINSLQVGISTTGDHFAAYDPCSKCNSCISGFHLRQLPCMKVRAL